MTNQSPSPSPSRGNLPRAVRFRIAASLLVALVLAPAVRATGSERPSVERLMEHLRVLGSESMEGRGTGTPGGLRAADYVEEQLGRLGLEPAGVGGGWRQPVPIHGSLPLAASRLTLVDGEGRARPLRLWEDYVLYSTGAQTFVPRPLPMVFVGYGIVAPDLDYNDYLQADVEGRIAVFLAGEPPSDDPDYFDGPRRTIHSDPERKFRIALSRGARGAVLVPSPREGHLVDWQAVLDLFEAEQLTPPVGVAGSLDVALGIEAAVQLFAGSRRSYVEVLELDRRGELESFELDSRLSFAGFFRERDFTSPNLAARLPGSEPLLRDEHLIVCAHYDHLGRRRAVDGDDVYDGVVDNASGTAAVLELARVLARSAPRRSILFLFFTGEEHGLLGSRYYRDHPLVPVSRTLAAINVDGLSFLSPTDDWVGIGAELSTLGDLLSSTLATMGLERSAPPVEVRLQEPFFKSDHLALAQAGIPSILVMEGTDYRRFGREEGLRRLLAWGRERYHSPFDDLQQPLDRGAMQQHLEVLEAFVRDVADTPAVPQWLPGAPYIGARLRALAEEG